MVIWGVNYSSKRDVVTVISYTCSCSAMTSQNICNIKGPYMNKAALLFPLFLNRSSDGEDVAFLLQSLCLKIKYVTIECIC